MEYNESSGEVKEYKKANCSLFRTPPVDFSPIKGQLEQALVQAWKSGVNAQAAVAQVLSDKSILDPLKEQIAQYMDFQKSAGMAKAEKEKLAEQARLEKEKQKKLGEIAGTLGKQAYDKKAEADATAAEGQKAQKSYDAAQSALDDMRARIMANLKELGGIEGYETLLQINEHLA